MKSKEKIPVYNICNLSRSQFQGNDLMAERFGSYLNRHSPSLAISAGTFIAYWLVISFPFYNNHIFFWIGLNALLLIALQSYLMRIARTIWLAFFVRYDPDWVIHPPEQPERTNKDQENNW